MNIRDRRAIHHAAGQSLANAKGDAKQILLIYLGIMTVMALAVSGLSVALNNRIADTGGLGNMGLRSVLVTAKSVLPLARFLILLGLELGYCNAALRISRGEPISNKTLFQSFRRFSALLSATILQSLIYFALSAMCLYVSVYIFMMLPVSAEFYELMMPVMESITAMDSTIVLDEATMIAAYDAIMPMYWIFAALFLPMFIPTHYRYRMVSYRLLDQPRPRGLPALRESSALMRRNRFALFRLDLSLWWFYCLQGLILLVNWGDVLLALLGITLPWSSTVNSYVFFGLSLILQFVIYQLVMNRVAVAYAVAYETLLPKEQKQKEEPQSPSVPWQNQY